MTYTENTQEFAGCQIQESSWEYTDCLVDGYVLHPVSVDLHKLSF